MSEVLKPCPFCGGKAIRVEVKELNGWNFIACMVCGCRTADYPPQDTQQGDIAANKWNRRVI